MSSTEARLASRFSRFLPASTDQRWGHVFERFWTELVGLQTSIECLGFSTMGPGRFRRPRGDFYITQVTFPPALAPGFIVIERSLIDAWLDAVVGPSEHARRIVSLAEHDESIITYLLMRAVDFLVERGAPPATLATHDVDAESAFGRLNKGLTIVEVDFVASSPEATGMIRLFLPEALTSVMEGWADQPRRISKPYGAIANVPMRLRGSIGFGRFSPIEVAMLGPGDIIFPLEHGLDGEEGASLILPGAALDADAQIRDGQWHFELLDKNPTPTTAIDKMENNDMATAEEATSQLTGSVDLRADFVVGGVNLTISDLHQMKPGRVFTLDRQVGQPIDVVVNNHTVARGELVDVDGKVGVRIVAISPR